MRRVVCLLLSAALLLGLLSGCDSKDEGSDLSPFGGWAAQELAGLALSHSGQTDQNGLEWLISQGDETELDAYARNAYQLEGPWEDMAVVRATGASAFEIAVVRMENDGAAVRAATAFMNYMSARQGDFTGYAPDQADMAANGEILQDGIYAALFICPDPGGASRAVEAALNGEDVSAPGSGSNQPITDVKALRDLLADRAGADAELEKLDDSAPDALSTYVAEAYGLTPDQWEECAVARDEASAFEVAVFRFRGSSDVGSAELQPTEDGYYEVPVGGSDDNWEKISAVEECLDGYLNEREGQFDSASQQKKLLHQAITITAGEYVVMLACQDAEDAAWAFSEASGTGGYGYSPRYRYLDTDPNFPDRCAFTPPNKDDMSLYDTSAIRAAWEKDDPSGLSRDDRKTYDAAKKVLKKVLKDGMSDYEKEFAIYNWVVNNVNYDWTHQDIRKETPRVSFQPYGGLVNRKAVCLGYATTFQLLCDLAGVECITVPGAAFASQEDHGWNMVRLNGEWYCVDATWDANVREQVGRGRPEYWRYFNVTSQDMADSDHQWDYANTPEASATDRGEG